MDAVYILTGPDIATVAFVSLDAAAETARHFSDDGSVEPVTSNLSTWTIGDYTIRRAVVLHDPITD